MLDLVRAPRKGEEDEALGALLRRRLGTEASRVLVEPLLAGLHAGDPLRLSTLATFPELRRWEVAHGSLIRGAKAAVRAAGEERGRKPIFATVWGGLNRLVGKMVEDIGADRVRLDRPVSAIHAEADEFTVEAAATHFHADALVLATPAFEASRLLGDANREASEELAAIPYASTAVVILVYPQGTASRLPEGGTGFVVPAGDRAMTACTWVSRKWPHNAYGDRAVVRCFVGRAGDERALDLSDEELTAKVAEEVEAAVPIGAAPEASRVARWNRAMPQYEVGHQDRLARIALALERTPGIVVTGAAYDGVGIADCVRQGTEAALQVRDFLKTTQNYSRVGHE
jgi:oxygen-dependent protoporphyrinogen oxidase